MKQSKQVRVESIATDGRDNIAYFEHPRPSALSVAGIRVAELEELDYGRIQVGSMVWFEISDAGFILELLKGEKLRQARESANKKTVHGFFSNWRSRLRKQH